jgi:integrase
MNQYPIRYAFRLDPATEAALEHISRHTFQSKASIMRRYVQEGVANDKLQRTCQSVAREDLTDMTYKIMNYRLKKVILPALGSREIASIHFEDMEQLLAELSHQKLSGSTINGYMKAAKSVFTYAYKCRDIPSIPHFPSVDADHQPRGYFTKQEYRKMCDRAEALIGSRFEYRKLKDKDGTEQLGEYFAEGECKDGRLIRKTTITPELLDLIIFATNSYVRPTDIKTLQHKHVTIVREEHIYLRLNPPETKGHNEPFVTMEKAVEIYERLTEHNKKLGRPTGPEAYVFFPNYETRDYALKELERQFAVLMWDLHYGKGPNGEQRTIYSLRHTCFMFRLMYGEKIDHVTLARNGRTSPEMIDRHYASHLRGEDNIEMLQSRRPKKKAASKKTSPAKKGAKGQ